MKDVYQSATYTRMVIECISQKVPFRCISFSRFFVGIVNLNR